MKRTSGEENDSKGDFGDNRPWGLEGTVEGFGKGGLCRERVILQSHMRTSPVTMDDLVHLDSILMVSRGKLHG